MNSTNATSVPVVLLKCLVGGASFDDIPPISEHNKTVYVFSEATTTSFDYEVLEKYRSDSESIANAWSLFDLLIEKRSSELLEDIASILSDVENDIEDCDYFVDYIKNNSESMFFETAIVRLFRQQGNERKKLDFINIVLSSHIDIFCSWYKTALLLSKDSNNPVLSFRANDILNYYSKAFDDVR